MAFPSTLGTHRDDLQSAWTQARAYAAAVKTDTATVRTLSAAGTLGASTLLRYVTLLADMKAELVRISALGGIAAYAQAQVNDPGLDIVGAFQGMVTQIDATVTWITTIFPKDGTGYLLAQTFAADGRQVDRVFTAAQTAGLRTALDALLATID